MVTGSLKVPTTYVNNFQETKVDMTVNCESIDFLPSNKKDEENTASVSSIKTISDLENGDEGVFPGIGF